MLARVGVNDLLLSADAFHQESIPLETVKRFALAAKECGTPVRLSPAWLVSREDENPYNRKTREILAAFADMQKLIGASNGPYATGSVKGFPYVVLPQRMTDGLDLPRCERKIADACAANPGKPVFVFAHVPPAGTTRNGNGIPEKTAMFSTCPQVVNISGHNHGSLADGRSIWQGAFTCL